MSDKIALRVEPDVTPPRFKAIKHVLAGMLLATVLVTLPLGVGVGIFLGISKGTWTTCGQTATPIDTASRCYHLEQTIRRSPDFMGIVDNRETAVSNLHSSCGQTVASSNISFPPNFCEELGVIVANSFIQGGVAAWCEQGFPIPSLQTTRRKLSIWDDLGCAGAAIGTAGACAAGGPIDPACDGGAVGTAGACGTAYQNGR